MKTLNYRHFEAGYCRHCERMTLKKGRFGQQQYPALCTLINHPEKGYLLFDTGYSERFFQQTARFPYSLYRRLTPVTLKKSLQAQLQAENISADQIRYVIISHFHADHIGGLGDFPQAQFLCHPQALEAIDGRHPLKALFKGFLPGLLPHDFHNRVMRLDTMTPLPNALLPFTHGQDLFGDGLLWAVPLPGHAQGQIGLFLHVEPSVFLIADSCWHSEPFLEKRLPHPITRLVHHHWKDYCATIAKLHELSQRNPNLVLVPSHCSRYRPRVEEN